MSLQGESALSCVYTRVLGLFNSSVFYSLRTRILIEFNPNPNPNPNPACLDSYANKMTDSSLFILITICI